MMLKGENANNVIEKIKKKTTHHTKSLPDDIIIEPYLDQNWFVGKSNEVP